MRTSPRTFVVLAAAAALGSVAWGGFNPGEQVVEHRFLPGGWTQSDAEIVNMSGIHVRLADGWKTYWRAPGEFGLPPRLELARQENIDWLRMHYPKPSVFLDSGVRTIGYAEEVTFPIEVKPVDHQQPVSADMLLHLGVCRDVCVPVTLAIPFRTQPGNLGSLEEIEHALQDGPKRVDTSKGHGLATCSVETSNPDQGYQVTYEVDYEGMIGPKAAAVFESSEAPVWFTDARIQRPSLGKLSVIAHMRTLGKSMVPPPWPDFRVTLISEMDYIEFSGCYETAR